MNFKEYQELAHKTAQYPLILTFSKKEEIPELENIEDIESLPTSIGIDVSYLYPALGLGGEVGEVQEKIKKIFRNKEGIYTDKDREELAKELGDVLWYINEICCQFQIDLEEVAEINIKKLQSRKDRNVIKSEGDNR